MPNPSPTQWTEEYKHPISYLTLEEGGGVLLLEEATGGKLVLEETGIDTNMWSYQTLH